jgi:hypothetical protein
VPDNTLRRQLVNLKDAIPPEMVSNCIYKINCNDCSSSYVGQTSREIKTRCSEHKQKCKHPPRNFEEHNRLKRDSAIAEHALMTGHDVDFDNPVILQKDFKCYKQRLHAEATQILLNKSAINRTHGVEISQIWNPIISKRSSSPTRKI